MSWWGEDLARTFPEIILGGHDEPIRRDCTKFFCEDPISGVIVYSGYTRIEGGDDMWRFYCEETEKFKWGWSFYFQCLCGGDRCIKIDYLSRISTNIHSVVSSRRMANGDTKTKCQFKTRTKTVNFIKEVIEAHRLYHRWREMSA
jgi:hypothetical protein